MQPKPFVIEVTENVVTGLHPCNTAEEAEKMFLSICKESVWNFEEYTQEDIEIILEEGFESFGNSSVSIYWITV